MNLHASPRYVLRAAATRLASRNAAASSGSIWPRLSAMRSPDLRDEKSTVAYAINSTWASTFRRSLFRLRLHYASERMVHLSLLYAKRGKAPTGILLGPPTFEIALGAPRAVC